MADWRMMGSAIRRRMGAPSHHGGGADALHRLNFVNYPEDAQPGRPEGTTKNDDFWTRAKISDQAAGRVDEDEWTRTVSENHPSVKAKRMKPEGRYFG